MYACFYVAEQNLLKCVRGKIHDEGRMTINSFTVIPCKGAADIKVSLFDFSLKKKGNEVQIVEGTRNFFYRAAK